MQIISNDLEQQLFLFQEELEAALQIDQQQLPTPVKILFVFKLAIPGLFLVILSLFKRQYNFKSI